MKKTLLILTLFFVPFIYSGCELSQDSSGDYAAVVEDTAAVIASSYSTASYDDLAVMEEAVDVVEPDSTDTGDGTCDQECDHECDHICLLAPHVAHHRAMNGYDKNGSADITFTVAYYDIDGAEQESYDALTTEKVAWNDSFTSELITPVLVKNVILTHQFAITGLAGENETSTINGTGTADKTAAMTHPLDKVTRSYHMTMSKVYSDVVWSTDRETYPYPLRGTIHLTINVEKTATTADREVEKTFTLDALVTFNGTCCPVLVIDKERTFIINISDGTATEE